MNYFVVFQTFFTREFRTSQEAQCALDIKRMDKTAQALVLFSPTWANLIARFWSVFRNTKAALPRESHRTVQWDSWATPVGHSKIIHPTSRRPFKKLDAAIGCCAYVISNVLQHARGLTLPCITSSICNTNPWSTAIRWGFLSVKVLSKLSYKYPIRRVC